MLSAVTHAPVPGRVASQPGVGGGGSRGPKPATRLHNLRKALEGALPAFCGIIRLVLRVGVCPDWGEARSSRNEGASKALTRCCGARLLSAPLTRARETTPPSLPSLPSRSAPTAPGRPHAPPLG